jgi:hypothetical protein
MKRLSLALFALVIVGSLAFAEGSAKRGQFGIQTQLGLATSPVIGTSSFGAKYMVTDTIAIRAEVGLTSQSSNGASFTGYELGGGFEYHFGGKGGVSPYAGAQLGYAGGSTSAGGSQPSEFILKGVFGGEYFFSTNFSLAGEIALGFDSQTGAGVTTTTFFTEGAGAGASLIATWYIN